SEFPLKTGSGKTCTTASRPAAVGRIPHCSLKDKLQCGLNLPRISHGRSNSTLLWRVHRSIGEREMRSVSEIEHLGAELKPETLPDITVLCDHQVHVVQRRAFNDAAPGVTVHIRLGKRESGKVEPILNGSLP